MVPFLVFYSMAAADNTNWHHAYWIHDKAKDVLIMYALYRLTWKQYRYIPLVCAFFLSIRLLWHIITVTFGVSINHPTAINYLFIILVTVCITIMVKETIRCFRQNG